MTGPDSDSSALVTGLRVIRERWWIVAIATLATVAVSLALAATATKQYTAESSLLVRPSQLASLIDPNANSNRDPERDASTTLLLLQSTAVAERVRQALKTTDSADALLGKIVANAEPSADIITIEATDPDPRRAAQIANAFAQQLVAFSAAADKERIDDAAGLLRRQISSLAPGSPQRAELSSRLNNIEALGAITTGDARVVDVASAPGSPSSPRPVRNALLAGIIGLVIGVAVVFLVDLFDTRIKTVEEFESLYGLAALATIPLRQRDPVNQRDRAAALEPFRILRNGLAFLATDQELRVVVVTSAVPSEGKSTVAAGLARAAALSGQRVTLVECDLRRPTFTEQFDLRGETRGLTTALVGGTPPTTLLHAPLQGLPALRVLPSGPTPPNAGELLRSAEMSRVLQELAADGDLVILDAPPMLPVADSHVLLENPSVDTVLVVARAYHARRDDARRCRIILDRYLHVRGGLVVNAMRQVDGDYYGAYGNVSGGSRLLA